LSPSSSKSSSWRELRGFMFESLGCWPPLTLIFSTWKML
jgi:hypothetical protein